MISNHQTQDFVFTFGWNSGRWFIHLKTYEGGVGRLNITVKQILWELLLRSFALFLHHGRHDIIVTQRHT